MTFTRELHPEERIQTKGSGLHPSDIDLIRQIFKPAIEAEAELNGVDPKLASTILGWGEFRMYGEGCFSLDIKEDREKPEDGDRVTIFSFSHKGSGIVSREYKAGYGWKELASVGRIPATGVELVKEEFGGVEQEILYAVCNFGPLGKLSFGITKEGTFRFKNELYTHR